MQVYTDWANHYLCRTRSKRLIHDLQTDVCDGVLLADIIEAVSKYRVSKNNLYLFLSHTVFLLSFLTSTFLSFHLPFFHFIHPSTFISVFVSCFLSFLPSIHPSLFIIFSPFSQFFFLHPFSVHSHMMYSLFLDICSSELKYNSHNVGRENLWELLSSGL
jgi:hypothetical protein